MTPQVITPWERWWEGVRRWSAPPLPVPPFFLPLYLRVSCLSLPPYFLSPPSVPAPMTGITYLPLLIRPVFCRYYFPVACSSLDHVHKFYIAYFSLFIHLFNVTFFFNVHPPRVHVYLPPSIYRLRIFLLSYYFLFSSQPYTSFQHFRSRCALQGREWFCLFSRLIF